MFFFGVPFLDLCPGARSCKKNRPPHQVSSISRGRSRTVSNPSPKCVLSAAVSRSMLAERIRSYSRGARRASRKFTLAGPCKRQGCPTVVETLLRELGLGPISATSGGCAQNLGQLWPTSGQFRPTFVDLGHISAGLGQDWPIWAMVSPGLTPTLPPKAPAAGTCCRDWSDLGEHWRGIHRPAFAEVGPSLGCRSTFWTTSGQRSDILGARRDRRGQGTPHCTYLSASFD